MIVILKFLKIRAVKSQMFERSVISLICAELHISSVWYRGRCFVLFSFHNMQTLSEQKARTSDPIATSSGSSASAALLLTFRIEHTG